MSKLTPATTPLTPPPTKSEIVEALTQRKYQQLKDQKDSQDAAIKSAWDSFLCEALKQLQDIPDTLITKSEIIVNTTGYRAGEKLSEVGFNLRHYFAANNETKKLYAKYVVLRNADDRITDLPDIRDIRAQIREALKGDSANRVKALLADAGSRKAIDKTLAKLDAGGGMGGQPLLAVGKGGKP